jgi:hypothetical protein
MQRIWRSAVLAAVAAIVLGTVPGASAKGSHRSAHGKVRVAADHLNNPRQVTVHHGDVYVAEAGLGDGTCAPGPQPGVGFTGSVTRVHHGHAWRVQRGLVSVCFSEGGDTEVVGVDAVAFRGRTMFGVATGTCPVPPVPQLGKVLRLDGGTSATAVGDPATFECTKDPDGFGPDSDPYGIAVGGNNIYVADAAGNDIVKVYKGHVSLMAVIPGTKDVQPVPTSLAWGPDGKLYIGTLAFGFGPGGAKVYRLDPRTKKLSVYASGLTAITGIAWGPHKRLYVSEFSTTFDQNGPGPNADVVSIPWGGGTKGRRTIGAGVLHFAGGVGVTHAAVYVSNWSIAGGKDGPFGKGNHGQLLRFPLPR